MHNLPDRPLPPRPLGDRLRAWLEWVGPGRVAAAAATVLAVVAGAYWLVSPPAPSTESGLPFASAVTTTSRADGTEGPGASTSTTVVGGRLDAGDPPPAMVVHVAGAVVQPGVYRLSAAARVIDAIEAAGGVSTDADLEVVNLAALVRDGDRVYVPRLGVPMPIVVTGAGGGTSPSIGAGSGGQSSAPIDINRANAAELEALPGVGPATAAAIVAHREEHGPFATLDDLTQVNGIGPAKLEALRGSATV